MVTIRVTNFSVSSATTAALSFSLNFPTKPLVNVWDVADVDATFDVTIANVITKARNLTWNVPPAQMVVLLVRGHPAISLRQVNVATSVIVKVTRNGS